MKREIRNYLLLTLTAVIWGISFVAQRQGVRAVGIFTFSFVRYLMASAALLPVIHFREKHGLSFDASAEDSQGIGGLSGRALLKTGGITCGIILCLATNLQQVGLALGCSAGKAGFLTAFYIVMVPVFALFIGHKNSLRIWVSVAIAVLGLYLLCIKESFYLEPMDMFEIACACVFSLHILVVDHFSPRVDGVRMSCLQFLTAGLLSFIPMVIHDMKDFSAWSSSITDPASWPAIIYGGLLASGVGYTLQIVGQKGINPSIASLIMSMESVFSVIAGFILLGERMSLKEAAGCVLMFVAVLIASMPAGKAAVGSADPE